LLTKTQPRNHSDSSCIAHIHRYRGGRGLAGAEALPLVAENKNTQANHIYIAVLHLYCTHTRTYTSWLAGAEALPPAVDVEQVARDESGLVRDEKGNGGGNLLGRADGAAALRQRMRHLDAALQKRSILVVVEPAALLLCGGWW
jgi:hypothetical protein